MKRKASRNLDDKQNEANDDGFLCKSDGIAPLRLRDGFVEFESDNDPYSTAFDDFGFDEMNDEIDNAKEDKEEEYNDDDDDEDADEEEMEQTKMEFYKRLFMGIQTDSIAKEIATPYLLHAWDIIVTNNMYDDPLSPHHESILYNEECNTSCIYVILSSMLDSLLKGGYTTKSRQSQGAVCQGQGPRSETISQNCTQAAEHVKRLGFQGRKPNCLPLPGYAENGKPPGHAMFENDDYVDLAPPMQIAKQDRVISGRQPAPRRTRDQEEGEEPNNAPVAAQKTGRRGGIRAPKKTKAPKAKSKQMGISRKAHAPAKTAPKVARSKPGNRPKGKQTGRSQRCPQTV